MTGAQRVWVNVPALARLVHADGLRFQSTGRVRDAENRYDRHFKKLIGLVTETPEGFRLQSPDEALCFNIPANRAASIFRLI